MVCQYPLPLFLANALVLLVFAGFGTDAMFIFNIAQIVESLGGRVLDQVLCVSLFAIANASARLLAGFLNDFFASRISRVTLLSMILLLEGLLVSVLPVASYEALSFLSFGMGFTFGLLWCVHPPLCADLYGVKYLGSFFNPSLLLGFLRPSVCPLS